MLVFLAPFQTAEPATVSDANTAFIAFVLAHVVMIVGFLWLIVKSKDD